MKVTVLLLDYIVTIAADTACPVLWQPGCRSHPPADMAKKKPVRGFSL